MAQTIKLKRTSVQGKIPTTSNLDLGELAINTYDGRIFFEKDVDGTLSIQEILTTDSDVTGSLNLNGAITASSLEITGNTIIDGNLTLGGNITIGDSSLLPDRFMI
jgi:cytoskeletal protein CcmA (bactofilin family)